MTNALAFFVDGEKNVLLGCVGTFRRRTSFPLKRRLLLIVFDIGLNADTDTVDDDDEDDDETGDIGDAVEVDLAFFRGLYL
jgi:hypothetical protein